MERSRAARSRRARRRARHGVGGLGARRGRILRPDLGRILALPVEHVDWAQEPSLAVFDRDEQMPDGVETAQRAALAIGLVQPETRTVALSGDRTLFVGRGDTGTSAGYLVCLFTDRAIDGEYACVSANDFARKGLALGIDGLLFLWGPTGNVEVSGLVRPVLD